MIPIPGLVAKHNSQFNWLMLISLIIVICALALRKYSQKDRLWVTFISILTFGYIPSYIYYLYIMGMIRLGSGICGNSGLVTIGKITCVGCIIILLYEIIKYMQHKRSL